MPAISETRASSSTALVAYTRRESKPFVLKTKEARFRANGNSAEAKRWLELRDELLASIAPGAHVTELTPEAHALVEQVSDLRLLSDLIRASMLRGEDVDADYVVRVSVATDRHLATLRKIRLLRAAPSGSGPKVHWTKRVHEAVGDLVRRDVVPRTADTRALADRLIENVTLPIRAINVPHNFPDDWLDTFIPALRERPDLLARLQTQEVDGIKMLNVDVRAPFLQLLLREVLEAAEVKAPD